jgi:hypothetical protein
MPGLVPGIHVFAESKQEKTWMAGTSPAMTMERLKFQLIRFAMAGLSPGHFASVNAFLTHTEIPRAS